MMKTRKYVYLFTSFALWLALILPATALAGGWAVITLDELPEDPSAGQPVGIGFTVLQHGRTPMTDLGPTVTLINQVSGEPILVAARPEGEPGHYTAELVFPEGGTWEWSIQAFSMNQAMPPLSVAPAGQTSVIEQESAKDLLPLALGSLALACLIAAMLLLVRTRPRWALAVLAAGLLVGGAGFALAAGQPATSPPSNEADSTLADSGQRLFIAKGCTTCHAHEQIDRDMDGTIFVDTGPDLSDFTADPEYLSGWLADPAAIKPETEMPNLGLDQAEIQALVEFLNSDRSGLPAP